MIYNKGAEYHFLFSEIYTGCTNGSFILMSGAAGQTISLYEKWVVIMNNYKTKSRNICFLSDM